MNDTQLTCKNCEEILVNEADFCYVCGAKFIRNRLTLKSLLGQFAANVFNYDNKFLSTFRDLFTKPEAVIDGYVNGVRKRYVDAISYFAISVTISSFLLFLLRKVLHINLMDNPFGELSKVDISGFDSMYDYQTLLSFLSFPIYAMVARIAYMGKKFNYTEHVVAMLYTVAQFSFVSFFVSLVFVGLFNFKYVAVGNIMLLILIVFWGYCYHRIFKLEITESLGRLFFLGFLFFIALMIFGLFMWAYMFATGQASIQDFIPQK